MSKYVMMAVLALAGAHFAFGQQQKQKPLMDNWFAQKTPRPIVRFETPPDPPGVPLDGGLIGLIAAGGVAGYRKYKTRKVEQ